MELTEQLEELKQEQEVALAAVAAEQARLAQARPVASGAQVRVLPWVSALGRCPASKALRSRLGSFGKRSGV